jgi:hypothetical protein
VPAAIPLVDACLGGEFTAAPNSLLVDTLLLSVTCLSHGHRCPSLVITQPYRHSCDP